LPRSLEQWLAHQSQLHPATIDLGLSRLRVVMERLGWQQPAVPVITIAGTNGKGSVAAYCTSILTAAGFRVGTFTSPHLVDYRERIRVHDRLVTGEQLVRAFERIESARLEPPEVSLTFFEYNTLAAFLIFTDEKLDAWVLEVGLGGRLDAVNAVDPTVAVVVSIGLDHQEYLGTTVEAIALEKAGIFRPYRDAVLGSRSLPPILNATASALGARPKRLGVEFDHARAGDEMDAGDERWHFRGSQWRLADLPAPALRGEAQYDNAATAIAALESVWASGAATEATLPATVWRDAVAQGLRSVHLAGRFQMVALGEGEGEGEGEGRPLWILDVAHNPDAARVLARNLRGLPRRGRTLAVCGILADKDAAGIAAELRDCFDAWWLASTEGARGTSAALLAERIGAQVSTPMQLADDVALACAAASSAATALDRVVVFGSFHTVGPALEWLERQGWLPRPPHQEYT
jgi:dihydrofolate synthase/folylpolyglutamate synthase